MESNDDFITRRKTWQIQRLAVYRPSIYMCSKIEGQKGNHERPKVELGVLMVIVTVQLSLSKGSAVRATRKRDGKMAPRALAIHCKNSVAAPSATSFLLGRRHSSVIYALRNMEILGDKPTSLLDFHQGVQTSVFRSLFCVVSGFGFSFKEVKKELIG